MSLKPLFVLRYILSQNYTPDLQYAIKHEGRTLSWERIPLEYTLLSFGESVSIKNEPFFLTGILIHLLLWIICNKYWTENTKLTKTKLNDQFQKKQSFCQLNYAK